MSNTNPPNPTFKPALILHGGAGGIHRSTLPPDLYAKYHASLQSYLRSTHEKLKNGASALDAAVHAVSLMEDDELFNCGRGSVFTSAGTIEMEASVMVTSLQPETSPETEGSGSIKRGAGVIQIKNVRHPIQLARECLLRTGYDSTGTPNNDGGNMHSQLAGPFVEEKLARDWELEFMPDEWFWTKKRWEEHLRGLRGEKETITMSQGTVGCVCLDQWGNLAVATSTGGLTNKVPGRVGDTPTLGAGFWAESWEEEGHHYHHRHGHRHQVEGSMGCECEGTTGGSQVLTGTARGWGLFHDARTLLGDCLPPFLRGIPPPPPPTYTYNYTPASPVVTAQPEKQPLISLQPSPQKKKKTRRAIAISGTGNGDSFLRTAAARTASAMLRFSSPNTYPRTLAEAVTAVAGPGGELQRSAGRRWGVTGEGMGGIIGIEAEAEVDVDVDNAVDGEEGSRKELRRGKAVFDFNCGGMWRAWIEEGADGEEVERVMVFRDEYR